VNIAYTVWAKTAERNTVTGRKEVEMDKENELNVCHASPLHSG
jgi:hypothetical protein